MKTVRYIIHTALIGGTLIVLPLALVIILLAKVLSVLRNIFHPMLSRLDNVTVGGLALFQLVILLLLVVFCFLAGLIAHTRMVKRCIDWLEDSILSFVPGYQLLKGMINGSAGLEDRVMEVVLVRIDDGWQIAFVIEALPDKMYTVLVPGPPNPWNGDIYHVEEERLIKTDITQKQAAKMIRQLGIGSAALLASVKMREKIPE